MVEINETPEGFVVSGIAYRQVFRNKAKAILAAHFVAMTKAIETGKPVRVMIPADWGEAILVDGTDHSPAQPLATRQHVP